MGELTLELFQFDKNPIEVHSIACILTWLLRLTCWKEFASCEKNHMFVKFYSFYSRYRSTYHHQCEKGVSACRFLYCSPMKAAPATSETHWSCLECPFEPALKDRLLKYLLKSILNSLFSLSCDSKPREKSLDNHVAFSHVYFTSPQTNIHLLPDFKLTYTAGQTHKRSTTEVRVGLSSAARTNILKALEYKQPRCRSDVGN